MSSFYIIKVLHLAGIFMVFLGIGGHIINTMKSTDGKPSVPKLVAILHGVGMLLVFLSGFGLLAHLGEFEGYGWIGGKFVVWVAFAVLPLYLYRAGAKLGIYSAVAVFLGAVAAFFALSKPF